MVAHNQLNRIGLQKLASLKFGSEGLYWVGRSNGGSQIKPSAYLVEESLSVDEDVFEFR